MTQVALARESITDHLEKVLYTARAHTTGGRDGGTSRSNDGRLNVTFCPPGNGAIGTNPEQLFAAGWSACFLSAIKLIAAKRKVTLPAEPIVEAEVDLGSAHGIHALSARLTIALPGLDRDVAQGLIDAAHQICPYSRATDGNIDVTLTLD